MYEEFKVEFPETDFNGFFLSGISNLNLFDLSLLKYYIDLHYVCFKKERWRQSR